MRRKLRQHKSSFQAGFMVMMVVFLTATLLFPGYQMIRRAEAASRADEGEKAVATLAGRFMAESGDFWQQLLSSALPKSLTNAGASTSHAWASSVSQILFSMRISTPATFLSLGIPVLRTVAALEEEEVMWPASDPAVPPLVSSIDPPTAAEQALGWTSIPQMLIYQTHNIESFVATSGKAHVYDNPDQTIIRVGSKLTEELTAAGVDAIQSKADNSSQDYTNAYNHSLKAITKMLEQKPSIEYVFDIHRDGGLPRTSTTTVIEGQSTARIYIVVGTNTKLGHPNYQANIEFARALNAKLNELYPGLSRGVRITDRSRYNQHVRDKALLIEVGGDQNSMDEALRVASFLAKAIVAVAKDLQPQLAP